MNEDAAIIELPDGSPGAVSDAGSSLARVAGGIERAGSTVARASATVGAWEGRARVSFDGRIARYGRVVVAVEQALSAARGAVRRYEAALEEARAKIRGLREQEEMAVARLTRAKGLLEEAQGRLESAQGRMSAVSLGAGALEPYSLAEQAQARRDAADAQGDIDAAQKQIDSEREEIRDRRNDAKRERTKLVEAEQDAAAEVRAAAAQLPDVQLPGGAASPSAYAGTIFAGPLSPLARDPRWASAMAKAAQDDKEEEEGNRVLGALDDAWDWTAPARAGAGNATSGLINELTFGAIDLGGDKDSGAYKGGAIASYVPWNPASALKSLGTGVLKAGGKIIGKEVAEKGAKRSADELVGAGGRGGGARGGSGVAPIPPPKRWGPLNGPGPVGEEVAKTFRSASYTERVLAQDKYLYRVWGGERKTEVGGFWSADPPAGPLQAKMDSALPPGNSAENVTVIRVPAGTKVYEGMVAPHNGRPGGGSQVVLEGNVPRDWIVRIEKGYANGP